MDNHWDQRYSQSGYYYGTLPNTFLAQNSALFKGGGKVLCLAEGEGRNAVYLAKQGLQVTAVDYSKVGLEKLKALADKENVHVNTVLADLAQFKFEAHAWDGIVSIWGHLPSELRRRVYGDCVRSLKSGGVFLLESYTPHQLKHNTGGPKDLDLLPTAVALENELRGLDFKTLQEIERDIQEGLGHRGLSAVVQVIGVKEVK